tara:strand:+ start:3916 stop:5496 length:1581 start_codon:yes stop_codon:yes gene_type:complete
MFTDVLVIGTGVAGHRAALAASAHGDVIIASKGEIKDCNTYYAQGGVAAVTDQSDSFQSHVEDTLIAGADLCDRPIVKQVVEHAPQRIAELQQWGMNFDMDGDKPALGREGGHSAHRILHSDGDATGMELSTTLDCKIRETENIRLFSNCFVLDLITSDNGTPRCLGAITHHPKYGLQVIWAKATIIASGGAGQVYRESTNPRVSTGDGLAIAYRAGVTLQDMAFMQFHPTTLYIAGAARSLITEAVRGEGAYLIDCHGERFMVGYHDMAELAPRDIVSRAILAQMAKTNHTHVYLDCRHLGGERFAKRFPGIYKLLGKFGIDPAKDPIPIHPSAHYMVGGIRTDNCGRTSLHGLYACGEVSATGLHGANRLASNSLLEGLVFGKICGDTCQEMFEDAGQGPMKIISDIRLSERSELDLHDVRSSLRSVMWRHVGIEREGKRLAEVSEMFEFWGRYTLDKIFDDRDGWEVQNMLLVGALMTEAARWRCESRGTHYRSDCPAAVKSFRVHDVWQRGKSEPELLPVVD